jgi:type I restriction enzyme S subunit
MHQYRLLVRAETTFDRRVTKDDFRELPLLLPPTAMQRVLADYLDAETSHIDQLIKKKRCMILLLNERWRSLTRHHMEKLTSEHGSIQLRHLVRCLDGRRVPLSAEERGKVQGVFPYFGASGEVDRVDDYLFDEILVLLGEDGAQLGDPNYPVAQVVEGKIWVNNHAHVLRPTACDPHFLAFHLNTLDRVPYISGGTREKITQDDMNRIRVPNLARQEQTEEARRLWEVRNLCDQVSDRLTRQIDVLNDRRQTLITVAVTGQLDIPGIAA